MWLLPTHNRPEQCRRFLAAAVATKVSTPGLVVVNGGPQPAGYEDLPLPEGWQVLYLPEDMALGPKLNWLLKQYPSLDWYGFVSDDNIPVTEGWDQNLLRILRDTPAKIVSCNDGWQAPHRMHGAVLWAGDLIREVGWISLPGTNHMYLDDVWEFVGQQLGYWHVDMETVVEHHHYLNNKAPMDPVYQRNQTYFAEDAKVYQQFIETGMGPLLERLSAKFGVTARSGTIMRRSTDLAGKAVLFATPCHGNSITSQTLHGIVSGVSQLLHRGLGFGLMTIPHESLLPRARNSCIEAFLEKTEYSHLLFVDADMEFTGDDVVRLLAAEQDLVAAVGVRKREGKISFCLNGREIKQSHETGLVAVDEVGTGFMMLSRACVEKMIAAYPDLKYTDRTGGQQHLLLFDTKMEEGYYWSEDYVFCRRWRAIGGSVYVDPMIGLGHVGEKVFRGTLINALTHPNPELEYEGFMRQPEPPPIQEAAE